MPSCDDALHRVSEEEKGIGRLAVSEADSSEPGTLTTRFLRLR